MAAPLSDLRVLDLSTVIAGPNCARYLADFGADVIKVERPGGDGLRRMAWPDPRDGDGLWWKLANRNKRTICLDLKDPRRPASCCSASSTRRRCWSRTSGPGTLERLGLGPEVLLARNERLVITRVSGFGQTGPYAATARLRVGRRGDVGLRRAQRGPDGQPLPPPIALTDEVTGLAAAFATMVAVHSGAGPGGRRQPARVAVPDDGPAAVALRR